MFERFLRGEGTLRGAIIKIVVLGGLNAFAVFSLFLLYEARSWMGFAFVVAATIAIDIIYLGRRTLPLKYLIPGTLLLLMFQIYPVAFNTYIAFTNYGTGNILTKEQAVARIEGASRSVPADAIRYQTVVLSRPSDDALALLLTDDDGEQFLGTAEGLRPVEPGEVTGEGASIAVGEYQRMTLREANDRQAEVLDFEVPLEDGSIAVQTFTVAARTEQRYVYDEARDVMLDSSDGSELVPVDGRFVDTDGTVITPGWRVVTGFDNFARVVNSPAIRGEFLRVFLWTFAFAAASVALTFALGLALAMALDDLRVKGRRVYRSLLIIPYALPSFMTALIWRGLLNQEFGAINEFLGTSVPWLTSRAFEGLLPKLSVLLVNTWLGFPYMFLICTGALQAIPSDLKEAAFVDGASGWSAFRRITLPLLLVAVGPLLIASFAFNFNNFNVIFLLTGGDPPIQGAVTPVGYTDILISYAYRLAFAGGRGQDYGLAAAVSVFIFMMVALFSAISFKRTRVLEEIN